MSLQKAKVCVGICVYNDWEFLKQTVDSLAPFIDNVYIFEGAWQTAIDSGANARSDKQTQDVIDLCLHNHNVEVIRLNAATETEQRQKVLEYCREKGHDFLWSVDADEIFPCDTIPRIKGVINKVFTENSFFGIKLCSFNFFGDLKRYYHGEYPRIYRLTPDAQVLYTNHVHWPHSGRGVNDYLILNEDQYKFLHLSYLRKNVDLFHVKMRFLEKEFGNNLYNCGYGEQDGKYSIPIPDNEFFDYTGEFPPEIKNHHYYSAWTGQNT